MRILLWLLANCALVIGTFAAGYITGSGSVRQEWDMDILQRSQEQLATSIRNQRLTATLQEQKNANLQTVNSLRRELASVRVRLPATTCTGIVPESSGGVQVQTTGTGELPASPQAAFDRFTEGVGELMFEADTTIEQCRVVMDWAKSQGL